MRCDFRVVRTNFPICSDVYGIVIHSLPFGKNFMVAVGEIIVFYRTGNSTVADTWGVPIPRHLLVDLPAVSHGTLRQRVAAAIFQGTGHNLLRNGVR